MTRLSFAMLVLATLACAGAPTAVPPPLPVPPTPVPPTPVSASADPGALQPWQQEVAAKHPKDVHDYYLLLPRSMFECEDSNGPTTRAEQEERILEERVSDGYLRARGAGAPLQVALYVDRAHGRDVIGTIVMTGVGDMCNVRQFAVWDEASRAWSPVEVLPERAIAAALPPDTHWWPKLPVQGTDTELVDEDGEHLLTLKWQGGRFVLR